MSGFGATFAIGPDRIGLRDLAAAKDNRDAECHGARLARSSPQAGLLRYAPP